MDISRYLLQVKGRLLYWGQSLHNSDCACQTVAEGEHTCMSFTWIAPWIFRDISPTWRTGSSIEAKVCTIWTVHAKQRQWVYSPLIRFAFDVYREQMPLQIIHACAKISLLQFVPIVAIWSEFKKKKKKVKKWGGVSLHFCFFLALPWRFDYNSFFLFPGWSTESQ